GVLHAARGRDAGSLRGPRGPSDDRTLGGRGLLVLDRRGPRAHRAPEVHRSRGDVPAPVPGPAPRPRLVVLQRHLAVRSGPPLGTRATRPLLSRPQARPTV